MRTNIVIDDALMRDALSITGAPSKKAVVEMGLQALIRQAQQRQIRGFRGAFDLTGDLDAMRRDA
jgi:Arc/MetJ family transcription regulator